MTDHTAWVASLSPWPEEFGLGRIRALLEHLGHPERTFDSVHVVGSKGKSTAARTIAELARAAGRQAGAYTSPHVSGWAERIWVDGAEADFERAVGRVRPAAEEVGATQFEALTAAAFAEFAERGVEVAAVEAGLGGRLDATNVVDAPVVLLTNVTSEHADVLGDTPDAIAREKLAVAHAARVVVLPDERFASLVPSGEIRIGGAREAAEAYLGEPVAADPEVRLPGPLRAPQRPRPGRRAHARGRRLAARQAARGRARPVRLDPARQGRRRHPRATRARGKHADRDAELQRSRARREGTRAPRRTVFPACRNRL